MSYQFPDNLNYADTHEYVLEENGLLKIGVSEFAIDQLGDIVFVELPEKGKGLEKEEKAAVVESTKAASDVYTPVSGEIIETNQPIVDDPSNVNKDPENNGWFFKIKIKNKSELDTLMNQADYEKFIKDNPN